MRHSNRLTGADFPPRHWRSLVGGLGFALACCTHAVVACDLNRGGTTNNNNYYLPYDAALFQIVLPPGRTTFPLPAYPVAGEVLFFTEAPLPSLGSGSGQGRAAPLYDCKSGATELFRGMSTLLAGHHKLYDTSVPGIGYRVYYYYVDELENEAAPVSFENTFRSGALIFPFNGAPQFTGEAKARIEFVATGEPIMPGEIVPYKVGAATTVTGTGGVAVPQLYRISLSSSIKITPPTCDVQNPAALTVTLPAVPVHMLLRGEGRDITSTMLDVACTSPSELSPTLTITANGALTGYAATLSNQEAGSLAAQGVGVQMWLYDPTTATYRPPTFGAIEPSLGDPTEGMPSRRWRFRLGASYIPVSSPMRAGKVRAGATLKFTYP